MAWSESSASCSSRDGVANGESFLPIAPRKSPMTAMSGLKTLEDAAPPPYTGKGPLGPPAPSAPGGTSVVAGGGATGSGDGLGDGEGEGTGSCAAAVRTNDTAIRTDESTTRTRRRDLRRIDSS